jgi:hypothetical protein
VPLKNVINRADEEVQVALRDAALGQLLTCCSLTAGGAITDVCGGECAGGFIGS